MRQYLTYETIGGVHYCRDASPTKNFVETQLPKDGWNWFHWDYDECGRFPKKDAAFEMPSWQALRASGYRMELDALVTAARAQVDLDGDDWSEVIGPAEAKRAEIKAKYPKS
jgi:hypothetical protein